MSAPRLTYQPDGLVGDRIRLRRRELGLTQRELGFPGCTYAYISRLESGDRVPSLGALVQLAGRLDTTALWLATGQHDYCPLCLRNGREAS